MTAIFTLASTIAKLGVVSFLQSFLNGVAKAFVGTISNIFTVSFGH